MSDSDDLIVIEPMSIDQLAGSVVLFFGAIGSLLLVVWQSRCLCRCRIGCSDSCYIFDCAREPPPTDPEDGKKVDKDKDKDKDKVDKEVVDKDEELIPQSP